MQESHDKIPHISLDHHTNAPSEPLLHDLDVHKHHTTETDMPMKKTFSIFGLLIVAGILTGFVLNFLLSSGDSGSASTGGGTSLTAKKDVISSEGNPDKSIFKDTAEGSLKEGGSEGGEGSFHLERPGGDSQTVYLTSSTVDLSKFVGKKVRVRGETFESQEVGWLMDVGYIEVIR